MIRHNELCWPNSKSSCRIALLAGKVKRDKQSWNAMIDNKSGRPVLSLGKKEVTYADIGGIAGTPE